MAPDSDPATRVQNWRDDLLPYSLLTLAFVFFSLNIVVGRAVHADVPPVGLSFWRWTVAAVLFLPFSIARLRAQWALVLASWRIIVLLSVLMMLLGNTLVYVGLQSSTALNGGLIPVSRPVIVLLLASMLFRGTVTPYQWVGIGVALIGVLLVITHGDPAVLQDLDVNRGDLWLVISSVGIASYQVVVARVPRELDRTALLQATMTLGAIMLLPVYLWETNADRSVDFNWPTIGAVLYVAVFPSIIAIHLVNTAIPAIGPARAGIFNYLQPLFVAAIAIPVLGENLDWYHLVALVLVAIGVIISSRPRKGR